MNPFKRTLVFAAVAAASALAAGSSWYLSQPSDISGFGDIGEEFFADFDEVEKATVLEVEDYDPDLKEVVSFSVRENDDGLWVIPSHHDYPAEAKDRLAQTATSLMGVVKTAVQSRSKGDHGRYGVNSPDADDEGRGTRLTLRDGSDNPLVDLIIGNEVEGRSGQYYVREPESDTTYIAELKVDLSARFSDWIEPDLLKTTANDLVAVTLDNYSINEERGTVEKTELLDFTKEDLKTSGSWTLADLKEDEELDASPISTIATNLANLKIVGVRPKPEGLSGNLRINPAVKQILQMQMQAQGYFIGGDENGKERLFSNEGELIAGAENGVRYTLYFGEIARGTARDIEVGLGDKEDEASDTEDVEEGDGPRRYLLVKVDFDESLLGKKPVEPLEPQLPEILKDETEQSTEDESAATEAEEVADTPPEDADTPPEDDCFPEDETATEADPIQDNETTEDKSSTEKPAETTQEETAGDEPEQDGKAENATGKPEASTETEDEQSEPAKPDPTVVARQQYDAALAAYQSAKSKYESDSKSWNDRIETGKKTAEELSTRFDRWYYVISSDSFDKFRITRKDVVSTKADEETATENEAADSGTDGN